jgi:hypothetical protein
MPAPQKEPQPAFAPAHEHGDPPPPSDSRGIYLAARLSHAAKKQRNVTLGISVMVFVVLLLRRHLDISMDIAGFSIKSLAAARDFTVLIISLALTRLSALMIHGARMARALDGGMQFSVRDFEDADQRIAAVEVGSREGDIGISRWSLESVQKDHRVAYRIYLATRFFQEISYQTLFWLIVIVTYWTAILGIKDMIRAPSLPAPELQVVAGLTVFFIIQSMIAMVHFFALRRF